MDFSSVLNFIFHQLLIRYNLITNFNPTFSTPSDFQVDGAMRFFKNASKKVIQRQGKKLVWSWEGAPKRCVSTRSRKKWRSSPKIEK